MAQMLFYENIVPISKDKHKNLSVEATDYTFASGVNSVPLMGVEIPRAARNYTIVFTGTPGAILPAVVLGIEDNKNAYVNDAGQWQAEYIPAFVRRYPFVFSKSADAKSFSLCVDESWKGCHQEGSSGQRLFDKKGERTPYLDNLLQFLEDYQNQFALTQAYCNRLESLGVLEPMKADFTMPGGEKKSLTGFQMINRDKLNKVDSDTIVEMMHSGELELSYYHLLSINNFNLMLNRSQVAD